MTALKLLSGEATVLTQGGGWHSILEWEGMCIRNLRESVLFSERDELLRLLNYVIKIDKNVKKVILFAKTWNKMVQKGVFFTACHSKRGILFQLWDHQIRVFFRGDYAYQPECPLPLTRVF